MKELMLMRHAKAVSEHAGGDFSRPLTSHGVKQVQAVAATCQARMWHPDLTFTSPAVRTLQTARLLEQNLGTHPIITDQALYLAAPEAFVQVLANAPNEIARILLIGHNPSLSIFANALAPEKTPHTLPTAGFVIIPLPIQTWQQIRMYVPEKH